MNLQKITALTAELVLRYYDNDTRMFLEYLNEDVLWYGPAEGQFIRGRDRMLAAWAAEGSPLRFTVGDISTTAIAHGPGLCAVALHYCVVTHYPSGNDIAINQRTVFTWCETTVADARGQRTRAPRILVCDITNPHAKDSSDVIYPVHFERVVTGFAAAPRADERLHFLGRGSEEYFLFANSIMWGDSWNRGRHCLLHLTDGAVAEVRASVRDIVSAHPERFLRCHSSHFVNPDHVRGLRRFAVTMVGGAELPVPEKGYTAFKREFQAMARGRGGPRDED